MKKIMKLFVYVAAAAMTLASCQKNEMDAPVKKNVHFTIKAGIETKTSIEETPAGDKTIYTPSWTVGDMIGVMFELGDAKKKDTEFTAKTVKNGVATFEGKYTFATNDGGIVDGQLYAFYPSAAFSKSYSDGEVCLDLKAVQEPTSSSFDPSCDLLIAKPCYYVAEATGEEASVEIDDMYFARMMSVLRINLKSEFLSNETVKSVSFNAEGMHLTGAMRFNLAEGTFKGNQTTSGNSEVKAEYSDDQVAVAGEKNSVYLVVAPVTIPSGTTLTFTIETENYDIVKTVTAPSEKVLPVGNVAVINLNIAEENCTAKTEDTSDYSGTYAILAKRTTGGYWYMTNDLGTASTKRFTAVEAGETLPEEDVALGASKLWQVSKSGEGYTVKSVGANQYITWSSGNSANLGDSGILFTITKTDEEFYNLSHSNRYLSLNATSGNNYFALYESQQKNLVLIPAVQGEEPATLSATAPSQMPAEGGNGSFTYELKNPKDGISLTATAGANWITGVLVGDEEVTYTVTANESEEAREAVITLTYGDLTETVTISQAGKPAEGGPTEVVDVLTRETTGVANNGGYSTWSGKTAQSSAVYAGQSAGAHDAIQLRTTNNNSGIVTTASGGYVRKITVEWQSDTQSGRILDVYGKNTAYTEATDLYDTDKQGTKLGSIKCGTSTELVITGDYQYIGLRSSGSAMYLTEIAITWSSESGSGSGETPEPEPDPTPDPDQPGQGGGNEGGTADPVTLIIDGSTLTSTATSADSDHTFGGVTLTMSKGAKYINSGQATNAFSKNASIFIGKTGAYIYNKTPIPGKIIKFEIYANAGASAKVSVGVNFSSTQLSKYNSSASNTYTNTLSTINSVYDCSDKLPDDAQYFWYQVTNNYNSQVQFRITYIPEN